MYRSSIIAIIASLGMASAVAAHESNIQADTRTGQDSGANVDSNTETAASTESTIGADNEGTVADADNRTGEDSGSNVNN